MSSAASYEFLLALVGLGPTRFGPLWVTLARTRDKTKKYTNILIVNETSILARGHVLKNDPRSAIPNNTIHISKLTVQRPEPRTNQPILSRMTIGPPVQPETVGAPTQTMDGEPVHTPHIGNIRSDLGRDLSQLELYILAKQLKNTYPMTRHLTGGCVYPITRNSEARCTCRRSIIPLWRKRITLFQDIHIRSIV